MIDLPYLAILYLFVQLDETGSQNSAKEKINAMVRDNPPQHGLGKMTGNSMLTKTVNRLRAARLLDKKGIRPNESAKALLDELEQVLPYWYDELVSIIYSPESGKIIKVMVLTEPEGEQHAKESN